MKTKQTRIIFFAGLLFITFFNSACNNASSEPETEDEVPTPQPTTVAESEELNEPQPDLAGTKWEVVAINGNEVLEATTLTAIFTDEGSVNGNGSCNYYQYEYEINPPNSIQVERGPVTQRICDAPISEQETDYFRELDNASTYLVDGDSLRIDNDALLFQAAPEPLLAGTNWNALSFNSGFGEMVSILPDTSITASFTEDGEVNGFTGCNVYKAAYEADGVGINVEDVNVSNQECLEPTGIMFQEEDYLSAIKTAVAYDITGDNMEWRDGNGELMVTFTTGPGLQLSDIVWHVVYFNDDNQEIVETPPDTSLTAQFTTQNVVFGDSGCSDYEASFFISGNRISIGIPEVQQRIDCDQESIALEGDYTEALSKANLMIRQGNQLRLLDSEGILAILFENNQ